MTTRRFRPALTALIGLAALLTGCTAAPNRSGAAAEIAAAARTLPGVTAVDERYANGITEGYGLYLVVHLADSSTLPQIQDVTRTVLDRFTSGGFDQHTVSLRLQRADDVVAIFGRDGSSADPTDHLDVWFDLLGSVDGAVQFHLDLDPTPTAASITVDTDGSLTDVIDRARLLAPRYSATQWILKTRHTRLDLFDGYPDSRTMDVVDRLAATDGQWSMKYHADATAALTVRLWTPEAGQREVLARAQLPVVAELGIPVDYTVWANDIGELTVAVGGCRVGEGTLEQELNREFGSC